MMQVSDVSSVTKKNISFKVDDDNSFESMFQKFIINKYGANFFKYTFYLNISTIVFLTSVGFLFYISQKNTIKNGQLSNNNNKK